MSELHEKKEAAKQGDKTSTGLVAVALLVSLGVAWFVVTYRGVGVLPWPRATADVTYAREACEPVVRGDESDLHNGSFTALTRDASSAFHATYLWNDSVGSLQHIVSVQESDPGSARSDVVRWSRDGRALLITGTGRLPLQRQPRALALAYVVDSGTLYELPACR